MEPTEAAVSAAGVEDERVAESVALDPESRARRTEPAVLRSLLEQMVLVRRFEEKAAELYTLGKIGGFCHLYIGQEAVAVGALSATNPTITSSPPTVSTAMPWCAAWTPAK